MVFTESNTYSPQTATGCLGNPENLEVARNRLMLNQKHVVTCMHSHLNSTKQLFQIIRPFCVLRQCNALIKTEQNVSNKTYVGRKETRQRVNIVYKTPKAISLNRLQVKNVMPEQKLCLI